MPIHASIPRPNATTRLTSSAGAVCARRTTTTTAASDKAFAVAMVASRTATERAPLTASWTNPATYTAARPAHMAHVIATLTGTIRRARSSSQVRRCTRGHSLANAHRNAGGIANAAGNLQKSRKSAVGTGMSQTDSGSVSAGGMCPRKAGSMCSGANVARKRK